MGPNRQQRKPAAPGGRGGGRGGSRGGGRGRGRGAPAPASLTAKAIPSMISSSGRDLIIDVLAHAASGGSVPVPERHFDGTSGAKISFQRNSPLTPAETLQRLFEGLGFPRDLVTQYITDLSTNNLFPSFANVEQLVCDGGEFQPFLVQSCFELFNCMTWFNRDADSAANGADDDNDDDDDNNDDDDDGDEDEVEAAFREELETLKGVFSDSFVNEQSFGEGDNRQLELYFSFQSEDGKAVLAAVRVPLSYPADPPILYLQPLKESLGAGQTPQLAVLPACTRELSPQARRAIMDATVETITALAESECLMPVVSAIAGVVSSITAEAVRAKPAASSTEAAKQRQEVADRRKAFVGHLKGNTHDKNVSNSDDAAAADEDGDDQFFNFTVPAQTALATVEDTGKYSEQVRRDELASDPALDKTLKADWQRLKAHGSLSKARADLPAQKVREDLRKVLQSSNVVVVGGETGSGKTTQIPQFVYEFMCEEGRGSAANIVCTQPRRLAATSVALRVAEERDEAAGGTVGYTIRLESCVSRKTQVMYCTTGIVLRRLQSDKFLGRVSHVVVDEIHERGVDTDFLLILLRDLLTRRTDLKVILMSATMDSDLFSRYFGGAPIISIAGRTFPVQVMHLEKIIPAVDYHIEDNSPYARPAANKDARRRNTRKNMQQLDYDDADADLESLQEKRALGKTVDASASTLSTLSLMNLEVINYELIEQIVVYIENSLRIPGAVLIFLPGMAEILRCMDQLKSNPRLVKNCLFHNLHSSLGSSEQQGVFKRPPAGKRKIILGTNIMETSVTIDDAVFVIDTGKAKENRYNARKSLSELVTVSISKANCRQRMGRAGRVREGFCFRLFTESQFETFADHQLCEMHRVPLESLILQIYSLHLGDEVAYLQKALTPPEEKAIHSSVKVLTTLGALTVEKRLTSLGQHLANLPLDVRIGKMIIHGALLQCLDPVLTMAACLATRSPFISSADFQSEIESVRKAFAGDYMSDQLSSWFAYSKWSSAVAQDGHQAARKVCNDCYLSQANLSQIQSTKRQYERYLYEAGFLEDGDTARKRLPPQSRFVYPPHVSLESVCYEAGGDKFNSNSGSARCILACLVAGLYPNVARLRPRRKSATNNHGFRGDASRFITFDGSECLIHPSSVAGREKEFPTKLVVYVDKMKTSQTFLREVSMVAPLHVILFGGGQLEYRPKFQELCVDEMTAFLCKEEDATLLRHLKSQLDSALAKKINDPSVSWESISSVVVRAIVRLLKDEGSSTQSLTVIDRREPRAPPTQSLLPEQQVIAPPAVLSDQPFKTGKTCFVCGQVGHVGRFCPHSPSNNKGGPPVRCFICGQWHFPVDCTLVKPLKR